MGGCHHRHHRINRSHLEVAKDVLKTFDHLFVLEYLSEVQAGAAPGGDGQPAAALSEPLAEARKRFVSVFGSGARLAVQTNNMFSKNANVWQKKQLLKLWGDRPVPKTDHFRRTFCNMNALDTELYRWVLEEQGLSPPRGSCLALESHHPEDASTE